MTTNPLDPAWLGYGPGDFESWFETLDKLIRMERQHEEETMRDDPSPSRWTAEIAERSAIRDAFLDAAEMMDARGEVIAQSQAGWIKRWIHERYPSPETAAFIHVTTADADAVTE